MSVSTSEHKKSVVNVLSIIVVVTVSAFFAFYSSYTYLSDKNQLVDEIKGQAKESAARLSRIVSPYLESYQPNEYEKLLKTEIQTENHYALSAILIHDYKMAEIVGEDSYIIGQIRELSTNNREYDPNSLADQTVVKNSVYSFNTHIKSRAGELIGEVIVYVTDRSLQKQLTSLWQRTIVTSLLLIIILVLTLIILLRRYLIRPLQAVSDVLSNNDDDGIPKFPLPQAEFKEIALLSETVNDMLSVIKITRNSLKKEHNNLENVIRGTRAGTWYWNIQTDETQFNEQWAEIIGYSLDELQPISIETWMNFAHPDDLEGSAKALDAHFKGESDYYECDARMRHKDGSWVWVRDRGMVTKWSENGEPIDMFGTHMDISNQKYDEERLALSASVFEEVHEGIIIADHQGNIVDVNDSFVRITGFSKIEAIGKSPRILKSGRHGKKFYANLWSSLDKHGYWKGEIWNKRKNGEVYPELLTISSVLDATGHKKNYVGLFSDISSIKEHELQLEKLAHYDSLTGLPNRFLFRDRLRLSMAQSKRHDRAIALLFLDLDGFKEVNDKYGHAVGDKLLINLAGLLSDELRDEDTVARIGGDEFTFILNCAMNKTTVTPVIERILYAASAPIAIDELSLNVSASIGVAMYPEAEDVDADQLIRQADQAMYQAKLAGKNRFHFFDPELDRNLRDTNETILLLEEALKESRFELFYQPKVNLRTREVIGVEGLIRWHHPTGGILSPGAFLPAIEGRGLMVEIGEWTIEQGLRQLQEWSYKDIDLSVSINLSAIHLQQSDFIARLKERLSQYPNIPPSKLEFEVLETSALANMDQVKGIIEQCAVLGIQFAIDDFGTGYSTLSYLKSLPAQLLKIDQSFVKHLGQDDEDALILDAVVSLAKAFRKEVIAEGLEDINDSQLLLDIGCELAQGYGIARPMPANEIPAWLVRWERGAMSSLNDERPINLI